MKNSKIPNTYPSSVFNPLTKDEKITLKGFKYHHLIKSSKGKTHIYERYMDNQEVAALRIDGPSDGSVVLDHKGNVKLLTGEKTTERGPGSGKLMVRTWGQQQMHQERTDIQYNSADDEESVALNILAYGDTIEENRGGERYISANKIVISADAELVLKSNHIVLQSGDSGKGKISMNAGMIEKTCVSDIENVSGQKLIQNFAEFTLLSLNPKGTFNTIIAGHYSSKIGGSYKQYIRGGYEQIVIGRSLLPLPEVYKVTLLRGNFNFKAIRGGYNINVTRDINIRTFKDAKIHPVKNLIFRSYRIKENAMRSFDVKSTGRLNLNSSAHINLRSSGGIGIRTSGIVRVKGSTILLN